MQDYMTDAELRNSVRFGESLARKLPPLHPDDEFRFPAATAHMALNSSVEDAVCLAIQNKNGALQYYDTTDIAKWVMGLIR